jgi:hypothetical protein
MQNSGYKNVQEWNDCITQGAPVHIARKESHRLFILLYVINALLGSLKT